MSHSPPARSKSQDAARPDPQRPGAVWLPVAALAGLTIVTRVGLYLGLSWYLASYWSYQQAMLFDGWGRIASLMVQGYGLSDTHLMTYFPLEGPPVPTAARPPLPILLFAAILRLFGEHLLPVVFVQAGIDALTAVVVYLFTRRLVKTGVFADFSGAGRPPDLTALLAAFGFVLFVPEWRHVVGFLSEPLFTLLLTCAVGLIILSHTRRSLAAAGILFGLAVLCRPSIFLFPFLLVPWLVWKRRVRWSRAVLVPLLMCIALGPWVTRNYLIFHRVVVTQTLAGYDLYRHSGVIEREDYLRRVPGSEGHDRILALLNSRGLTPQTISEPDLDDLLRGEALRIIWAHPWRYLNLSLHRAAWLFSYNNTGMHSWSHLWLVYLGATLALFGSVAVGIWRYRGAWIGDLMPLWLLIGYTIIVHAFIVAQFRFLVPLLPLLLSASAHVATRALLELHRHSVATMKHGY
jgi:4-amino-4-deoxy-L-arabinose transferase-like glycosyltransferase